MIRIAHIILIVQKRLLNENKRISLTKYDDYDMSFCTFIATIYEMPEVKAKAKYITVKEAIELEIKPHELLPWEKMDPNDQIEFVENEFVENEEDLNELVIEGGTYYDVSEYTSYPFIYEVNFSYSKIRIE